MRTVRTSSVLDADADSVWERLTLPATFLEVTRGLLAMPALAGRADPVVEGERGTGWLLLGHVVPLHRHTIEVVRVDDAARRLETEESGGPLRRWHHVLEVEPLGPGRCRYTDTVELDAGPLTPVAAASARALYRYRHRRWRELAGRL